VRESRRSGHCIQCEATDLLYARDEMLDVPRADVVAFGWILAPAKTQAIEDLGFNLQPSTLLAVVALLTAQ
jgi:hypothetical protein